MPDLSEQPDEADQIEETDEELEAPGGELEEPPFEGFSSGTLLRGADLLTPREASQDLARGPGNLVVWAGERGSGKTTLTVELYERHRARKAATRFVGTRTLHGFEERIHPARAASGRVVPHATRTEADPEGRELLHLAVGPPETQLLFADLPGEIFRQIRDNDLPPGDVPLLRRADKLAILVDGDRIADARTRSTAVSFAKQLIDRLSDGGIPDRRTEAMLILTKLDRMVAAGPHALEYWEPREEALLGHLQVRHPAARVFRTGARGSNLDNDGMECLMAWLMAPTSPVVDPRLDDMPEPSTRIQRLRLPKRIT